MREAAIRLPDCIVDAELVANDGEGRHSYDKLMSGYFLPNVWCFDLLATDGVELRGLQLERRGKLSDVLVEADSEMFGFSDIAFVMSMTAPRRTCGAFSVSGGPGRLGTRQALTGLYPLRSGHGSGP